ncbi:MAG: thioredoxin family protein [Bacteroidetes bacterium]|nr:MAG: thioredoxin family protein [Bacteroidota bacterium]
MTDIFRTLLLGGLLLLSLGVAAQEAAPSLYQPEADARAEIDALLLEAQGTGKHVLLQVGGNWCTWCIRFHRFCKDDAEIDSFLTANYHRYYLNYSRENTNDSILADLGYPQRFGFPVFVVLDAKGRRLHTQDSALLEAGKGYDRDKVMGFFRQWTPAALDPERYR